MLKTDRYELRDAFPSWMEGCPCAKPSHVFISSTDLCPQHGRSSPGDTVQTQLCGSIPAWVISGGGGGVGRCLYLLAGQGGELIDFRHGPSSSSPEIANIWDSVSECYRQDEQGGAAFLVLPQTLMCPDPSPCPLFLPQLRKQKKCPRRIPQWRALPESNFWVNGEKKQSFR